MEFLKKTTDKHNMAINYILACINFKLINVWAKHLITFQVYCHLSRASNFSWRVDIVPLCSWVVSYNCQIKSRGTIILGYSLHKWRCSDLMVSLPASVSTTVDSSPSWGHCVAFLGKVPNSLSASVHPGV